MVFGDTHASIALSSGTATFRVGVGIPGLVRVNGAVRAAAGTTADNAGFSFEGNTQTGMFLGEFVDSFSASGGSCLVSF